MRRYCPKVFQSRRFWFSYRLSVVGEETAAAEEEEEPEGDPIIELLVVVVGGVVVMVKRLISELDASIS